MCVLCTVSVTWRGRGREWHVWHILCGMWHVLCGVWHVLRGVWHVWHETAVTRARPRCSHRAPCPRRARGPARRA